MRPICSAASSEGVTGKLLVQDILNELVVIVSEDELESALVNRQNTGEGARAKGSCSCLLSAMRVRIRTWNYGNRTCGICW